MENNEKQFYEKRKTDKQSHDIIERLIRIELHSEYSRDTQDQCEKDRQILFTAQTNLTQTVNDFKIEMAKEIKALQVRQKVTNIAGYLFALIGLGAIANHFIHKH